MSEGPPVRLADLLSALDLPPDAPLVHSGDQAHTRAEVEDRAADVAAACAEVGVAAGCPVGVMLPHGADVVPALFGVWQAGGVYVPMNPRLTDREAERILDAVPAAAIVTTPELAFRFDSLPLVVLDGDRPADARPGTGAREPFDADVALVQFTSGTTGTPKAVLLTHTGVRALIDGVVAKLRGSRPAPPADGTAPPDPAPARAPMPNLIPVSLSLWAGIYNVLFAFRTGAPVVVMDRFDPREFAALVERHQLRSSVLPPAAIAMLADDESIASLAPLRFVRSITAPLSPLQARRFKERFGIAVLNGWGQTEIGGEIVGWNASDSRQFGDTKLGSVGRPHQGVEIVARDEGGVDVTTGGPGELWVRTPALSAGYADGKDLADRMSADGYFRTGDVGRIDDDGFVWIEGRASDMINRGGLKVHPGEVEEVLRLSPAVADAAVVGVVDDRLGEVPVAFLVLVPGAAAPADDDLEALCRQHLAPYKIPVRYDVIGDLPRNEVGKVLKHELAAR